MVDEKISDLGLMPALADGDFIEMIDVSDTTDAPTGTNKKGTPALIQAYIGTREVLTSARTYYVRTDGNDSNTGLVDSAGGAFLTIQKGIDTLASIDFGAFTATISVGAGTYSEDLILRSYVGAGSARLTGDATTPSNVVINATGNTITAAQTVGLWVVSGFQLKAGASNFGISSAGSAVNFGDIDFNSGGRAVALDVGARSNTVGDLEFSSGHDIAISVQESSSLTSGSGQTWTLTGTPAWGTSFVFVDGAATLRFGGTKPVFSGAATGSRYLVRYNGVINTFSGGATYFPGNSAGSASVGGQYV